MSDRLAVFNEGRIEQVGPPAEVYEHPQSEFIAGFVGVSNVIERDGRRYTVRPEKIDLLDDGREPQAGWHVEPGVGVRRAVRRAGHAVPRDARSRRSSCRSSSRTSRRARARCSRRRGASFGSRGARSRSRSSTNRREERNEGTQDTRRTMGRVRPARRGALHRCRRLRRRRRRGVGRELGARGPRHVVRGDPGAGARGGSGQHRPVAALRTARRRVHGGDGVHGDPEGRRDLGRHDHVHGDRRVRRNRRVRERHGPAHDDR